MAALHHMTFLGGKDTWHVLFKLSRNVYYVMKLSAPMVVSWAPYTGHCSETHGSVGKRCTEQMERDTDWTLMEGLCFNDWKGVREEPWRMGTCLSVAMLDGHMPFCKVRKERTSIEVEEEKPFKWSLTS